MSARQTAALAAFTRALVAAFSADAALASLVYGRIHDGAPRGRVLPYLAFADAKCSDFSGGDSVGARVRLTVEVLTADGDRSRALAGLDRAVEIATETPPTLSVGTLVLIRLAESAVERLKDGRTWRASAVLEALIDD